MSAKAANQLESLAPFRNEPYADFSTPGNRKAMEEALAQVRSEFGREYELFIAGERIKTGDTFRSYNPSKSAEVVGVHQKATPELAAKAVESAHTYFEEW